MVEQKNETNSPVATLNETGVKAKGVWKKERFEIKLKDKPMDRRAIEIAETDGSEMRIRSIKIGKFFKENNKFAVEIEKFVPAK